MYVWFIGLNHSKYRFLFHAVYIGIMNAIRKPTFHAARYNRVKYLGSDVRSRPLQSAPMDFFCPETVVILHREQTRPGSRNGGFSALRSEIPRRGFFPSPDGSELYLCPTNWHLSDKGVRSARPGRSPESNAFLLDTMDNNRKPPNRNDRKTEILNYKYSFRLNEEQNIRFNELLCKAGLEHNRSRFIVKKIFAEEFVVVRRDPSTVQFVTRLNDFYFQFQRVAQNYNQVVKAINAHFSNVAIPHQIAMLEQRTRELKALSIEILHLAKQAKEWLRI